MSGFFLLQRVDQQGRSVPRASKSPRHTDARLRKCLAFERKTVTKNLF